MVIQLNCDCLCSYLEGQSNHVI